MNAAALGEDGAGTDSGGDPVEDPGPAAPLEGAEVDGEEPDAAADGDAFGLVACPRAASGKVAIATPANTNAIVAA